jgi:nitrogen fixation protein NifU and related proteins
MQLDDLYRQVIMDHYQRPRNQGDLDGAVKVDLKNPTCGDEISLRLKVEDGVVKDVRFTGSGCSISVASASMMTEAIKGLSVQDALDLATEFRSMMRGEQVNPDMLGELEALQGVSKFPARIKCALLAWQALEKGTESATSDGKESSLQG